MSDDERHGRPFLLGERQKLGRKLSYHAAIECHIVRDPEAVENRK